MFSLTLNFVFRHGTVSTGNKIQCVAYLESRQGQTDLIKNSMKWLLFLGVLDGCFSVLSNVDCPTIIKNRGNNETKNFHPSQFFLYSRQSTVSANGPDIHSNTGNLRS